MGRLRRCERDHPRLAGLAWLAAYAGWVALAFLPGLEWEVHTLALYSLAPMVAWLAGSATARKQWWWWAFSWMAGFATFSALFLPVVGTGYWLATVTRTARMNPSEQTPSS